MTLGFGHFRWIVRPQAIVLLLFFASALYLVYPSVDQQNPDIARGPALNEPVAPSIDDTQRQLPPGHPQIPDSETSTPSDKETTPAAFSLTMPEPGYELCCGMIPSKVKIMGNPIIKNTGGEPAGNVMVRFELFYPDGKRIPVSGQDNIERWVGDLGVGESRKEPVEFTLSLLDGYEVQKEGALARFTIVSDSLTRVFEESFSVPLS